MSDWPALMLKKRWRPLYWFMSLFISSISNEVLLAEAVLVKLNSMLTYNIVSDLEEEWGECLLAMLSPSSFPQHKQSQWPARFFRPPSAPAAALSDIDWQTVHRPQMQAKHVITQTTLCPFLPSTSPPPQLILCVCPLIISTHNIMFCWFCIFVPLWTSN